MEASECLCAGSLPTLAHTAFPLFPVLRQCCRCRPTPFSKIFPLAGRRGGCPFHTRHKLTRIKRRPTLHPRTSILPHRYVLSSDYTLSHPGYFASNLRYSATTKFRSRNRHTGRGQPATRLDGTRLTHGRRRRTRYTITSSFSLFAAATRRCESLGGNSGGGGFAGSGTLTRESTRGIDAAADRWAPLPRP